MSGCRRLGQRHEPELGDFTLHTLFYLLTLRIETVNQLDTFKGNQF